MENPITDRLEQLTLERYDWRSAADITTLRYWCQRLAETRESLRLRRELCSQDQLALAILGDIEREIAETSWGRVLVLAEEFVELDEKPDGSTAFVRKAVERIHADLCRPRFAGWQPDWRRYRAWHLALAERLLLRLPAHP